MDFVCPDKNCQLCERLLEFRKKNIQDFPNYYNAPVPSFGDLSAQILIVGLAPGLNGANQTGRPFTNDYAGDVLYPTLKKYNFAEGNYQKRNDDGFTLKNVRVTNSVRCVPPKNIVKTDEIKNCGIYLQQELSSMPNLKIILSLGAVAHYSLLSALKYKKTTYKFAHGAVHLLEKENLLLINSYHTSRYNINTGVLTYQMFDDIVAKIKKLL